VRRSEAEDDEEDMMMSSRGDGAEGKKCGSAVSQIRLRQWRQLL